MTWNVDGLDINVIERTPVSSVNGITVNAIATRDEGPVTRAPAPKPRFPTWKW